MHEFFEMPLGSSGAGWHDISPMAAGCPKEYQFARVRKIRRYERHMRRPLSVGVLLHAARAQYLYDGRHGDAWKEAMIRYKKKVEEVERIKLYPGSLAEALKVFDAYVAYWEKRPAQWTEVLAVEYQINPRIVAPHAPEWAKRSVRLDSVERWKGRTWIGEAKSVYAGGAGRLGSTYELHGQILMALTLWGEKETKRFGELAGVLLDPLVKGSGTRNPSGSARIALPMETLKHALGWFKRDLVIWLDNARHVDWGATVPRTMNCVRPYGPCDYRDLCRMGREGSLGYVLEDGTPLHKWKPSPGKERAPWE